MIVDDLWKARVPDYAEDALTRGHQYKNMFSSRLILAIGVKHVRFLISIIAWEQL